MEITKESRIYVSGHRGLVGSAIVRRLSQAGFSNLLLKTRQELDLTDRSAVNAFFASERPDFVFNAAAKVGGILANDQYPADFIRENMLIQSNVIDASYESEVGKFLFLGSSCIYPKFASQPLKEEYLLSGPLEPTNEWYAVAKIAGIKLCQAYRKQYGFRAISLMPTNLYGPGDNFNLGSSHVLPALIRKFHEAKAADDKFVTVLGTGTPRREFLFVEDLADACVHLMAVYDDDGIINVGTGEDVTIAELANIVKRIVGFHGDVRFDSASPDGTPRKLLDIARLSATGWHYKTRLVDGIERTYRWFVDNITSIRR